MTFEILVKSENLNKAIHEINGELGLDFDYEQDDYNASIVVFDLEEDREWEMLKEIEAKFD